MNSNFKQLIASKQIIVKKRKIENVVPTTTSNNKNAIIKTNKLIGIKPSILKDNDEIDNSKNDTLKNLKSTTNFVSNLNSDKTGNVTAIVAIDCEMVEIDNNDSAIARCSIVNDFGEIVYDKFIRPASKITDFRTNISGITPICLKHAPLLKDEINEIHSILKDKIIVGHTLSSDLKLLELPYNFNTLNNTEYYKGIRDVAYYKKLCPDKPIALKTLSKSELGYDIQDGSHDSVVDARVALLLYHKHKVIWEKELAHKAANTKKAKK